MSDLIEVCGLWVSDGKKGKYMAGNNGKLRYWVFPNDQKGNDKAPTHRLLVSANKPRDEEVKDNKSSDPF